MTALALNWVIGESGAPALMTRRETAGRCNAAFLNEVELRWPLMWLCNTGLVAGEMEMDGMRIYRRNACGRRG